MAEAPLALCEVQGYAYAAHQARAAIAVRLGATRTSVTKHRLLAEQLKTRFNRDFWLEELGWYRGRPRTRQASRSIR